MDLLAGPLELFGLFLLSYKIKWGFAVNILACLSWIFYVSYTQSTFGLLFVVIPGIFINILGFLKWGNHALH
jgi:hypothetical protein